MKLPNRSLPWPILWAGVELIAEAEGCKLTAYRDIADVWTIGWGQTAHITGGMSWTQAEADADLCRTLTDLSALVHALLLAPTAPRELAAFVSLAYNIGLGAFSKSTVLAAHNRGDKAAAAAAFALWNKATINGKKQVVQGLALRRAREAEMYAASSSRVSGAGLSPDVAPVAPLAASPTALSGGASVAAGGLALASQYSQDVAAVARSLAINPLLVCALIAVAAGAIVLWRRWKQRREGVA